MKNTFKPEQNYFNSIIKLRYTPITIKSILIALLLLFDLSPPNLTAQKVAIPAAKLAINAGDGQSATAGTAVAIAPSVLVTDENGNPVLGVNVTFAVASGGGTVDPETVMTDANGIASVTSWTLGTTAGTNTLTATSGTLTGSPLTFTATGTAGPAAKLVLKFDSEIIFNPEKMVIVNSANNNFYELVLDLADENDNSISTSQFGDKIFTIRALITNRDGNITQNNEASLNSDLRINGKICQSFADDECGWDLSLSKDTISVRLEIKSNARGSGTIVFSHVMNAKTETSETRLSLNQESITLQPVSLKLTFLEKPPQLIAKANVLNTITDTLQINKMLYTLYTFDTASIIVIPDSKNGFQPDSLVLIQRDTTNIVAKNAGNIFEIDLKGITEDFTLEAYTENDTTTFWSASDTLSLSFKAFGIQNTTYFPGKDSTNISIYPTFSATIEKLTASSGHSDLPKVIGYLQTQVDSTILNKSIELNGGTEYSWGLCIKSGDTYTGLCSSSTKFTTRPDLEQLPENQSFDFKIGEGLGYELFSFPFAEGVSPNEFLTGNPIFDWRVFDIEFNELNNGNLKFTPGNALWVVAKEPMIVPNSHKTALPNEVDVRSISLTRNTWSAFSLPFISPDPISFGEILKFNKGTLGLQESDFTSIDDLITIYSWDFNGQGWNQVYSIDTLRNSHAYVVKLESTLSNSESIALEIPYTKLNKRGLVPGQDNTRKDLELLVTFNDKYESSLSLGLEGEAFLEFPDFAIQKTRVAFSSTESEASSNYFSKIPISGIDENSRLVISTELFDFVDLKLKYNDEFNKKIILLDDDGMIRHIIDMENEVRLPIKDRAINMSFRVVGASDPILETIPEIPLNTELSQNYPNPFNPSTTIRFGVHEQSHVSLIIYDIMGRKVMSLVNEEKTPGFYSVSLDANSLASGMYLYRLQSGNINITKKMSLIK